MSEDLRIKEIQCLKQEMKKPLLKTMGLFDEPSNMMSIET